MMDDTSDYDDDDDDQFDDVDYNEPDLDAEHMSVPAAKPVDTSADDDDGKDASQYSSQGSVVAVQRLFKGISIDSIEFLR